MLTYRIVIVDDHPLFRGALRQALSATLENSEIVEAGSMDELTARLADGLEVDLILLDLTMPGVQGLSGLVFLRGQHPPARLCRAIVSCSPRPSLARPR